MEHYACLTSSTASTWGVPHILERNHSFLGMFVSVAILSVFHSLIYSFTSSDHVLTSFCEREVKVTQSCPTLWDPSSPGENTGVGSLSHLQGIFSIQGVNPGLPNCRRVLYQLSHKGSPTILEWVLCDPIDGNPPGSPISGILQARTLEWVTISFSNAWKWKVKVKSLSRLRLCDLMDCSPPGSSVHWIFQARVLEWGARAFSNYQYSW